ncbi:hypothetical protein CW745_12885 [Psychromonas sp. psych-6C06]|uniref:hypothetical protein n=1 Tax=Psychromonas sp. psych-6C06 TaxID=2058089 RepID=UPI000C32F30B|nr:hypothetical protein [Psychromonas sp. psych-6C06]PKF60765.1 hypothetical protein CW745_12885 [Psychromonas sp. psych-6C06]
MKKRIEFPLFELIVIIILLFILAVFALPKFVGVGVEARIKTLNATALNLDAVNRILYSRAVIKGLQDEPLLKTEVLGEKDAGGYLVYGELRAQEEDLKRFLEVGLYHFSVSQSPGVLRLYLDPFKNDGCYLDYIQATKLVSVSGEAKIQKAFYRIQSTGC